MHGIKVQLRPQLLHLESITMSHQEHPYPSFYFMAMVVLQLIIIKIWLVCILPSQPFMCWTCWGGGYHCVQLFPCRMNPWRWPSPFLWKVLKHGEPRTTTFTRWSWLGIAWWIGPPYWWDSKGPAKESRSSKSRQVHQKFPSHVGQRRTGRLVQLSLL